MPEITAGIVGLITLVIIVIILTALGPTIIFQTDTSSTPAFDDNRTHDLENTSATAGTMYGLIELLYPIIGVIIVITAGFVLATRMKL